MLAPEELIEWLLALVPWMSASLGIPARRGRIVPHLRENPRAFFRAALRDLDARDLAALDIPAAGAYRS